MQALAPLIEPARQFSLALMGQLLRDAKEQSGQDAPGYLGGTPVFSDAKRVNSVLRDIERFDKGFGFVSSIGRNRVFIGQSEWEARMRLTQKLYTRAGRRDRAPEVRAAYEAALDRFEGEDPEALRFAFKEAAFDVFWRAIAVEQDPARDRRREITLIEDYRHATRILQYLNWSQQPGDVREAVGRDCAAILERLRALMGETPARSAFFKEFQENGAAAIEGFDAGEEFLTNFAAGTETTISSLLWGLWRFSQFPEAQERLRAEQKDLPPGEASPGLTAFAQEVLRLHCAIPIVSRKAVGEQNIEGLQVPDGAQIVLSLLGLHRKARHWEDPLEFKPARREFLEGSYDKKAFLPFVTGPRACGGATLARMELEQGLAALLARFRVAPGAEPPGVDYALTWQPASARSVSLERIA